MIKLYVNDAFFPILKNILKDSNEEINIIIYNWSLYSDDLGSRVSQLNEIIFSKIKEGVKVKVIVGNVTLWNELKKRGVYAKYNRLRGLNHAKLFIIDNKIATLGSHNISENAFSRNEEASILSENQDFVKQCKTYFDILFLNCV